MASRRAPPPVPRSAPSSSDKKYVKSTWEYKANEPGELTFSVGEVILVVTEDPSGWWIGELNGVKGQFPVNFTEPCAAPPEKIAPPVAPKPTKLPPITTETPKSTPSPISPISPLSPMGGIGGADPMSELRAKLANRSTIAPGEVSAIKKDTTPKKSAEAPTPTPTPSNPSVGPSRSVAPKDSRVAVSMIAKPPVAPRSPASSSTTAPNVSQLKPIRPLVKSDNNNPQPSPIGIPLRKSENVPNIVPRSPASTPSSTPVPTPVPTPAVETPKSSEPEVEKALVTFDYQAAGETEISLVKGDTIVILERNDSGWWNGELSDGTKGWFPSDFVELLASGPTIEERLAEVGSKEPRLNQPKRAMGKSGRRPPTRGKKAGAAVKSCKTDTSDAPADLKNRTTVVGLAPIKLDDSLKLKKPSPLGKSSDDPPPSPIPSPASLKSSLRSPSTPHQKEEKATEEIATPGRLVALKKRDNINSSNETEKPTTEEVQTPGRLVALKKRDNNNEEKATEKPTTEEVPTPGRLVALKKRDNNEEKAIEKPTPSVEKLEPKSSSTPRKVSSPRVSNNNVNNNDNNSFDSSSPLPGNLGDFGSFQSSLLELFNQFKNKNITGDLHPNPILQKSNPQHFAVSFQSIAGHKCSFGDSQILFALHDAINPLLYAIAHNELGKEKVSALVGESKNVNDNCGFDGKKAANLTTDAASLLISSNLFVNDEAAFRCFNVQQIVSSLVGPQGVGFDMPTYLSSSSSNDHLHAAAYLMGAQNVLSKKKSVKESIDLVLQLRSIALNSSSAASLASSLASAEGSCLPSNSIHAMLNSLKKYGPTTLPIISSISGALILIIPSVGGLSIYSPLLNNNQVGAKALEFCNSFLSKFNIS